MRQLMSFKKSAALSIGLMGSLLLASTTQGALFVSEKEIMRQSRVQWMTMKKQMPLSPSPRLQTYVECITNGIIDVLDDSYADLSWEVLVFDDDSINAFAMPGGKVGVFTGILRVADTPDALAAVIGHEIAHLTADHVMQRAKKEARTDALVILGGAATGMGDVVRAGATIGLNLPFNRGQESEADLIGLEYMAKAGYDPRASIYLWKNMSNAKQDRQAEFLSTHPSDDRRMDDLVKNLTPALIHYNEARENGTRPSCQP